MPTLPNSRALVSALLLATALGASAASTPQAAAPAPAATPASNLLGTVTTTAAGLLTLKLENGSSAAITLTPQTRLLRTAPGEKTLRGATAIHLEDLETGDRVLVLRPAPGDQPGTYTAAAVVAMKQADIAQAHSTQAEDWQRRGVGGVVKSIDPGTDPATATIVLGTAIPGRTLTLHLAPATIIRRYAPDSVNFADAKAATLASIHPGDQLRARGDKNEAGTEVTAAEIVSGTFRNVAGTILSVDPASNSLTVTNLATRKPVTLHLTPETQMRKLPPEMAQRLASANGGTRPSGARPPGAPASPDSRPAPPSNPPTNPSAIPPANPSGAPGSPAGPPARSGDPSAMLQRAPVISIADLKKGDAVMVVTAEGSADPAQPATAITLIAGVEPLLEGGAGASQNLFSASWNLGGGGEAPQ